MIPDYIVIILSWVLLILTVIMLISDIIVMCVVNKKLKAFNKLYKEYEELGDFTQHIVIKYNELCKEKMKWLKEKNNESNSN